jgi:hypothetical protein
MSPGPKGIGSPALDDAYLRLLGDVARTDPYYESLSPAPSCYERLCTLESLGYIRYCPYPEEYWVILPAGKEVLAKARSQQEPL